MIVFVLPADYLGLIWIWMSDTMSADSAHNATINNRKNLTELSHMMISPVVIWTYIAITFNAIVSVYINKTIF